MALLYVSQRRHERIVLTEVDDPVSLVKAPLLELGTPQMHVCSFARDSVNGDEVVDEASTSMTATLEQQVFDPVAVVAKSLEAAEPLKACLLIELPDLVAVEPGVSAAYLTPIAGTPVNRSPEAVPFGPRQQLRESGKAGTSRNWLNGQTQVVHVLGMEAIVYK